MFSATWESTSQYRGDAAKNGVQSSCGLAKHRVDGGCNHGNDQAHVAVNDDTDRGRGDLSGVGGLDDKFDVLKPSRTVS